MRPELPELPGTFRPTRESLHSLACYVVAPAFKARTGHIGLRPVGDGFGTPPLDGGVRVVLSGDRLGWEPGKSITVTSLRAAARFVGIELSADPGVGTDLPPYLPDVDLDVDRPASLALGAWYSFGQQVLDNLSDGFSAGSVSDAQLWPEHFDLAVVVALDSGAKANVGFSPGDGFEAEPYAYVGPQRLAGLSDPYWNAHFGAYLPYASLAPGHNPAHTALNFIVEGLERLASPSAGGWYEQH